MIGNGLNFGFINQIQQQQQQQQAKKAVDTVNAFDSAAGDLAQQVEGMDQTAFNSELLTIRAKALHAVLELANDILEDDLDDGELPSDRLDAYLHPEVMPNDDENAQLEQQIMQITAANMADAMSSLGVSDDLITQAFGTDVDEADEAIERIAEIIEVNAPKGEDGEEFVTAFLYGESDLDMEAGQVDEYDAAEVGKNKIRKTKSGQTLVYKGVKAVRNGKITVVNKRVGNTTMKVKLSPKQKAALRKAVAKAVTPNALKKRVKSLRLGMRSGIYKANKGL